MTRHLVFWKEPRLHSYFLAASAVGNGSVVSVESISSDTPELPCKQWIFDTPVEVSVSLVQKALRRLSLNQGFREI